MRSRDLSRRVSTRAITPGRSPSPSLHRVYFRHRTMSLRELEWAAVPPRTLNIPATLASGQNFRWRFDDGGGWWGVIGDAAVHLRPEVDGFWWQTFPIPGRWELIENYFALDVDLERLYCDWIEREPRISGAIRRFAGMRILRQDASEAFFSFLCASCNTIVKITRTIAALAERYGEPIAEIEGRKFYRFPEAGRLAEASESALRSDLWGYRAPRVIELARHVASQPEGWLEGLRRQPYRHAHAELAGLFGIGAKIADCICLFALWHNEAVPIDIHVRRIAVDLFRPELKHKSLTPSVYGTLGDLFRERFGPYAGWAQQYLFFADLRVNRTESPSEIDLGTFAYGEVRS